MSKLIVPLSDEFRALRRKDNLYSSVGRILYLMIVIGVLRISFTSESNYEANHSTAVIGLIVAILFVIVGFFAKKFIKKNSSNFENTLESAKSKARDLAIEKIESKFETSSISFAKKHELLDSYSFKSKGIFNKRIVARIKGSTDDEPEIVVFKLLKGDEFEVIPEGFLKLKENPEDINKTSEELSSAEDLPLNEETDDAEEKTKSSV